MIIGAIDKGRTVGLDKGYTNLLIKLRNIAQFGLSKASFKLQGGSSTSAGFGLAMKTNVHKER